MILKYDIIYSKSISEMFNSKKIYKYLHLFSNLLKYSLTKLNINVIKMRVLYFQSN